MSQNSHYYAHPSISPVNNFVNHPTPIIQYSSKPVSAINPNVNANSYSVVPPPPYQDYPRPMAQNEQTTMKNELERKIQHFEQKYVQEANQTINKLLEYSNNQLAEKERKLETIFSYLQEDAVRFLSLLIILFIIY